MNNVTAYIGKDHGGKEWTTRDVVRVCCKALAGVGIDGATFCECSGVWRGETECSIRIDLLNVDHDAARKALKWACRALMQWSIVYTVDGKGMLEVTDDAAKRRAAKAA